MRKVFLLDDLPVGSLMTPRTKMDVIHLEDPPKTSWRKMAEGGHTYYPVYLGEPGNVEGIVSVKALRAQTVLGRQPDLEAALLPALYLPESTPVLTALERFKEAGTRLAVIINEFGAMEGIATLTESWKPSWATSRSRDRCRSHALTNWRTARGWWMD